MSNASAATIVLLAIAFAALGLTWIATSTQAGLEREMEEIDGMDCSELFEYILTEDTTQTPRNHAHLKYLLECKS